MKPLAGLYFTVLFARVALGTDVPPPVQVDLKAFWAAPPFWLEILSAEANAYWTVLDSLADGELRTDQTDADLYESVLQFIADNAVLSPTQRSLFSYALALHDTAPLIETFFLHYDTLKAQVEASCRSFVLHHKGILCDPVNLPGDEDDTKKIHLPFDHIYSPKNCASFIRQPLILYTDFDQTFPSFHKTLKFLADSCVAQYIVRYRRSSRSAHEDRLWLSGYGVEMAFRRTDYIVIDDRLVGNNNLSSFETNTAESEVIDDRIKPVPLEDLINLGYRSVQYLLNSDDPINELKDLSQNFPRRAHNLLDVTCNRTVLNNLRLLTKEVNPGRSGLWINGIRIDDSTPFSILNFLNKEHQIVSQFTQLGLTNRMAIDLLQQSDLNDARVAKSQQRYDSRDLEEGGGVVIWMNDIEKDRKYRYWSNSIKDILKQVPPGHFRAIRKNLNHVIITVDFAKIIDLEFVAKIVPDSIEQLFPIRFGFVMLPDETSPNGVLLAKVFHYLLDEYGRSTLVYDSCQGSVDDMKPEVIYQMLSNATANAKSKVRNHLTSLNDILSTKNRVLELSRSWARRLSIDVDEGNIIANGVFLDKTREWFTSIGERMDIDTMLLQEPVYRGKVADYVNIYDYLLKNSSLRRNKHLLSKNEAEVSVVDLAKIELKIFDSDVIYIPKRSSQNGIRSLGICYVVADFCSSDGKALLHSLLDWDPSFDLEVGFLHTPDSNSSDYCSLWLSETDKLSRSLTEQISERCTNKSEFLSGTMTKVLVEKFGLTYGLTGAVFNGRIITSEVDPVGVQDIIDLIDYEVKFGTRQLLQSLDDIGFEFDLEDYHQLSMDIATISATYLSTQLKGQSSSLVQQTRQNVYQILGSPDLHIVRGEKKDAYAQVFCMLDPLSDTAQKWSSLLQTMSRFEGISLEILFNPENHLRETPIKRFYRYVISDKPEFDNDELKKPMALFENLSRNDLYTMGIDAISPWIVMTNKSIYDLDNIILSHLQRSAYASGVRATYELSHILLEGYARMTAYGRSPRGIQLSLTAPHIARDLDTVIMANLGYFQLKTNPGIWNLGFKTGRSRKLFRFARCDVGQPVNGECTVYITNFEGKTVFPQLEHRSGYEGFDVLGDKEPGYIATLISQFRSRWLSSLRLPAKLFGRSRAATEINIYTVASGHLYERFAYIMMLSVVRHTNHTVKFWFIENFLSPAFKETIGGMSEKLGFEYELITYKWPRWLRGQREKQREIWGYKILFLDALFPLDLDKVIFVDADQIVRTDLIELVDLDLENHTWAYTPMGDSRPELEPYRFWKSGFWGKYLRGKPYHISALYVVDLKRFRQIAAGDALRTVYQQLSADKESLANLDQDLPNYVQHQIPIYSLPADWLWCQTWCSDESLATAKTIDLCQNPKTKTPKLERARQIPEWEDYDAEIARVVREVQAQQQQQQEEEEEATMAAAAAEDAETAVPVLGGDIGRLVAPEARRERDEL